METIIPLRLIETPDVATYRLKALALLVQQGVQFRFPERARQRQPTEHGLLTDAKGQVLVRTRGVATLGAQDRVVALQLPEPGGAIPISGSSARAC